MNETELTRVSMALTGTFGASQQRIAEVGVAWLNTLLSKNADYGSSVWDVPVLAPDTPASTAIRVRMSDKVNRLHTLLKTGVTNVKSESLDDTIGDLGSYCLLYLADPARTDPDAQQPQEAQPQDQPRPLPEADR